MGLVLIIVIAVVAMASPKQYRPVIAIVGAVIWLLLAVGNSCNDSRRNAYQRGFYDGMNAPQD